MIFSVTLIAVETKNSNNMNDPTRIEICPTWIVEQTFDNAEYYKRQLSGLEYRDTHCEMSLNSNVLDLPFMSDLKDILTDTLNFLVNKLDKDADTAGFRFLQSWVNRYTEGQHAPFHTHANSQFSGVCFFDDDSPLVFHRRDPWYSDTLPISTIANSSSSDTWFRKHNNYFYEAKAGSIVIFPSSMTHSTLPARGDRMTLAFNTFMTGDFCGDKTFARVEV